MCIFVIPAAVPNPCQIPRSAGLVQKVFGTVCKYRTYLSPVLPESAEKTTNGNLPATTSDRIIKRIGRESRQLGFLVV